LCRILVKECAFVKEFCFTNLTKEFVSNRVSLAGRRRRRTTRSLFVVQ
jgi:hypothetical protein